MPRSPLGPRELADEAGVSTDTLRHYERRGLLPPPERSSAGYRRYAPDSAERVRLIQRALAVGFTLNDLVQVLTERDKGGAPCRRVRALVGDRLEALERRIADLVTLRKELRVILADWDDRLAKTPAGNRAHLLGTLAGRPQIERAVHARRSVRLRRQG